jgi:1-deoxy-D-xylulose-5-phosphate synthase
MSISKPVGGLANYLNRIITGQWYNRIKQQVDSLLAAIPAVGKTALKLANYLEEIAKGLIVPGILFEELGFRYLGPVNAHDLDQLLPTLQRVRELSGPILLHVLTVKGKGFEHAEKNPIAFHGTPVFNARTGRTQDRSGITFSQVFAHSLEYLARQDEKIVAIVAAMTSGTALDQFAQDLPERFFDVGIAESHAVTLAAGMAAEGLRPVVVVYSTFLQRAYDEVLHDVCLQNLPVVFALDRGGVVGEDGGNELALMLKTALARSGPTVIRYPRGVVNQETCNLDKPGLPLGRARVARPGKDVAILGLGNMLWPALEAAESLARKGIQAAVIDPRSIKPLDTITLADIARTTGALLTVEDHVLAGGFGSAVMEFLQTEGMHHIKVESMGFPDRFIEHGTQTRLFQEYGLTAEGIEQRVLDLVRLKNGS